MSINAKDFRLPLKSKKGEFALDVELDHNHWERDVADLHVDINNIISCKRHINKIVITKWVCYDEEGIRRGANKDIALDVTDWFMGPKGPVSNDKIAAISFAHAINQLPSVRTPWVKDVCMDVSLTIHYAVSPV